MQSARWRGAMMGLRTVVFAMAVATSGAAHAAGSVTTEAMPATSEDDASPAPQRVLWDVNGAAMFAGPAPVMVGVDAGRIRRTEGVGVRLGGGLLSTVRPMPLAPGNLYIAIPYVSAEGCATVDDQQLVFRVCGGPLVGATMQAWDGFARPGPRRTPWVAARLGAQYEMMMGRDLGMSLGFDFTVPVVSPHFRSVGPDGWVYAQRKSRPVGYMLRIGVAFRGRKTTSCHGGCPVRSNAATAEAS